MEKTMKTLQEIKNQIETLEIRGYVSEEDSRYKLKKELEKVYNMKLKYQDVKINDSYRKEKILRMIPKDVKSVLDIGSENNIFYNFNTLTIDVIGNPDIKQDLNKNQFLPLKDNSFDIVILNQVLEHLTAVENLIKEVKRVSKKYIFLGLPNEVTFPVRIKTIFGKIYFEGYNPLGHKHRFTIRTIEQFRRQFFKEYKIIKVGYLGTFPFSYLISYKNRDIIAKLNKELFAKEVFYILEKQ